MHSAAMPECAAVVVLYHPGPEVPDNIRSWAEQVGRIYAVDNTEAADSDLSLLLAGITNLSYLPQGRNLGIAAALNIGARSAAAEGYQWLLTMDQDSRADGNMVARLASCREGRDVSRIGIIAACQAGGGLEPPASGGCREVTSVMTSGNLLNLEAFHRVGPYSEELFIDYVDHEYCLRLRQHGFLVLQDSRVLLEHRLGDYVIHDLGFKRFAVTNHTPLRRYYITRNRFLVMRRYREFSPVFHREQLAAFWRELYRLILFENSTWAKLAMVVRGYRDYLRGKTGPFGE